MVRLGLFVKQRQQGGMACLINGWHSYDKARAIKANQLLKTKSVPASIDFVWGQDQRLSGITRTTNIVSQKRWMLLYTVSSENN